LNDGPIETGTHRLPCTHVRMRISYLFKLSVISLVVKAKRIDIELSEQTLGVSTALSLLKSQKLDTKKLC